MLFALASLAQAIVGAVCLPSRASTMAFAGVDDFGFAFGAHTAPVAVVLPASAGLACWSSVGVAVVVLVLAAAVVVGAPPASGFAPVSPVPVRQMPGQPAPSLVRRRWCRAHERAV